MSLRLFVEIQGSDDVDLFVGVEKWRGRKYVPFEGSYGFGRDRITTGWLKASLRTLDEPAPGPSTRCRPWTRAIRCSPAKSCKSTSHWGRRQRCSGPASNFALSWQAGGCGHATRSPASFPPRTNQGRGGSAPCAGGRNTLPDCLFR